jgi:hypothetical protein
VPKAGKASYDPDDPSTYDIEPIMAPDIDVTGMPWPVALEALVQPYGFTFNWRRQSATNERIPIPRWDLLIYRTETTDFARNANLQRAGTWIDTWSSEVAHLQLTRDVDGSVGRIEITTDPAVYEIAGILAPRFEPEEADAEFENRGKFVEGAAGFEAVRSKYRELVMDCVGDGHWDYSAPGGIGAYTIEAGPLDLSSVLIEDCSMRGWTRMSSVTPTVAGPRWRSCSLAERIASSSIASSTSRPTTRDRRTACTTHRPRGRGNRSRRAAGSLSRTSSGFGST